MELSQNLGMNINMELGLMLSPKMLEMLKILNLPYAELVEKIKEEAESNPVLEIDKRDAMIEYLRFHSSTPVKDFDFTGAEERPELEEYIKKSTNLEDHLMFQLDSIETTAKQKELVQMLVRSVDDKGYLVDFEAIKAKLLSEQSASEEDIEEALEILQAFEPEGVGARDLVECLLIQVREYNFDSKELRRMIEKAIKGHLQDIGDKKFTKVASALKINEEGVQNLADFIRNNLNPFPGSYFSNSSTPAIPSFKIKVSGGKLQAENIEEKYGPGLSINPEYLRMLDNPKTDAKTMEYIKEKVQKAKDLMEQIAKRHETIQKIVDSIIETQKQYLTGKRKFPESITQKSISDKFGIHPSTTSRAIAGKYIETPLGVIKIKTLFPRDAFGLTRDIIKDIVAEIIAGEDKKFPMSDQQILAVLESKGLKLKRRTVAEYRNDLGAGTSGERIA